MRPMDLDNDQAIELIRRAPMASGYAIAGCGGDDCGPHFVLLDEDGDPIAQVIISPSRVQDVFQALVAFCPVKGRG